MSFFDGVKNLDEIPDDPFALPDNTYRCRIVSAEHNPTRNDPNKYGILVKYQIIEGDYSNFLPFGEWIHTPNSSDDPDNPQIRRSYANLKKHFIAYGFGADELAGVTVEALKDREVYIKTRSVKENGRTNIKVSDLTPVSDGSGIDFGDNSSGSDIDF